MDRPAGKCGSVPNWSDSSGWPRFAAAVGLVVGLFWQPLGIAAAVGFAVLMIGAVGFHVKFGDYTNPETRGNATVSIVLAIISIVAAVILGMAMCPALSSGNSLRGGSLRAAAAMIADMPSLSDWSPTTTTLRTRAQIEAMFDGFALAAPGVGGRLRVAARRAGHLGAGDQVRLVRRRGSPCGRVRFTSLWATPGKHSRVGFMKILLTLGVVVGVIFAINKFRARGDADVWHEVTTR
jgi:hypothetical protein